MGDRCYFSMDILKRDKKVVDDIVFGGLDGAWAQVDEDGGILTLDEYSAEYGYYDERLALAKEGIVFKGHHGSGGVYGGCVFACYGGEHFEANSVDGVPVARIHKPGIGIDHGDTARANHYYKIVDLVDKYFAENGINAND